MKTVETLIRYFSIDSVYFSHLFKIVAWFCFILFRTCFSWKSSLLFSKLLMTFSIVFMNSCFIPITVHIKSIGFIVKSNSICTWFGNRWNVFLFIFKKNGSKIVTDTILRDSNRFKLPIIFRQLMNNSFDHSNFRKLYDIFTNKNIVVCKICCIRLFRFSFAFEFRKMILFFKKSVIGVC